MENSVLKRSNGNMNFNNMTDEQLQEWHTAFLSEAQRENYVNHNLEIVRHYRTEAIARAPAFDIERNAIDAAIARHGLCVSNAITSESVMRTEPGSVGAQEDVIQPPPLRRPRIDTLTQLEMAPSSSTSSSTSASISSSSTASTSSSSSTSTSSGSSTGYGHYVALAHIFSDAYTPQVEPAAAPAPAPINNDLDLVEDADLDDMAIKKTIDSLGLRRT